MEYRCLYLFIEVLSIFKIQANYILKWCKNKYLSGKSSLFMNNIFRSVYFLQTPHQRSSIQQIAESSITCQKCVFSFLKTIHKYIIENALYLMTNNMYRVLNISNHFAIILSFYIGGIGNKFLYMFFILLNGYRTAESLDKMMEEICDEVSMGKFTVFDKDFLKRNAIAIGERLENSHLFQGKDDNLSDSIIKLFIYKTDVINQWDKLINTTIYSNELICFCEKSLKQLNSRQSTNETVNNDIKNGIICLTKFKAALLNAEVNLSLNPQHSTNSDSTPFLFGDKEVDSLENFQNYLLDFIKNIAYCSNISAMFSHVRYIKCLKKLETFPAFIILSEVLFLFTKVQCILEMDPYFSKKITNDYILAIQNLNLNSEFTNLFYNISHIIKLIKLYGRNNSIKDKCHYLQPRFEYMLMRLDDVSRRHENFIRLVTLKIMPRIYFSHMYLYSVQCYILFAMNFYSSQVFNKGLIGKILQIATGDQPTYDLKKPFSEYLEKLSNNKIKLLILPRNPRDREDSCYEKNIKLFEECFEVKIASKKNQKSLRRLAGVICFDCTNIDNNGNSGIVLKYFLICLKSFIYDQIADIIPKQSEYYDLHRDMILEYIIWLIKVFREDNKNVIADGKKCNKIFGHVLYRKIDDKYIHYHVDLSLDILVNKISTFIDREEVKLIVFVYDIVCLFHILSSYRTDDVPILIRNLALLRKCFIEKLSVYFNTNDLKWPGLDNYEDLSLIDKMCSIQ